MAKRNVEATSCICELLQHFRVFVNQQSERPIAHTQTYLPWKQTAKMDIASLVFKISILFPRIFVLYLSYIHLELA